MLLSFSLIGTSLVIVFTLFSWNSQSEIIFEMIWYKKTFKTKYNRKSYGCLIVSLYYNLYYFVYLIYWLFPFYKFDSQSSTLTLYTKQLLSYLSLVCKLSSNICFAKQNINDCEIWYSECLLIECDFSRQIEQLMNFAALTLAIFTLIYQIPIYYSILKLFLSFHSKYETSWNLNDLEGNIWWVDIKK